MKALVYGVEKDLDDAMVAKRRSLGMMSTDEALSYDREESYLPRSQMPRGRAVDPPMNKLRQHPQASTPLPARPASANAAAVSRSEASNRRQLTTMESSILAKLDGKASHDLDVSRERVLTRIFRDSCPNGDRYADEADFAATMGRLMLGASSRAGTRGLTPHYVLAGRNNFDISPNTVSALFRKYSEMIEGEPLVDMETFYRRLKATVQPPGSRDKLSLELEASKIERELADHPYAPNNG